MHACDSVYQTHELTYVIGHAHSHLWKFATWRFVCGGLTVQGEDTDQNQLREEMDKAEIKHIPFRHLLPVQSGQSYFSGIKVWQYTWSIASQRNSPESWCLVSLWGLHLVGMLDCPHGWPRGVKLCDSKYPPQVTLLVWLRCPTLHHVVTILSAQGPQANIDILVRHDILRI